MNKHSDIHVVYISPPPKIHQRSLRLEFFTQKKSRNRFKNSLETFTRVHVSSVAKKALGQV